MSACRNDHLKVVEFFLNKGSNQITKDSKFGKTALFLAYVWALSKLLQSGAVWNICDYKEWTPLMIASQGSDINIKIPKYTV